MTCIDFDFLGSIKVLSVETMGNYNPNHIINTPRSDCLIKPYIKFTEARHNMFKSFSPLLFNVKFKLDRF